MYFCFGCCKDHIFFAGYEDYDEDEEINDQPDPRFRRRNRSLDKVANGMIAGGGTTQAYHPSQVPHQEQQLSTGGWGQQLHQQQKSVSSTNLLHCGQLGLFQLPPPHCGPALNDNVDACRWIQFCLYIISIVVARIQNLRDSIQRVLSRVP